MTASHDDSLATWATRFRAQTVSSEAAVQDAAGRHRPELEAYRVWRPQAALTEAKQIDAVMKSGRDPGPLAGVPVSVKDLYGVPGFDTFAGSAKQLPDVWNRPGPVVERLLAQGAVVMGKTQTVEFAYGGLGVNAHYRGPHNPLVQTRLPGGSSSGAGVSVAEGSAWVALGTDTAGSGRIPAAWTGTVGFKTSAGRWSTDGIVPLSTTLDTVAVLARTAQDVQYALIALDPHFTEAPAEVSVKDLHLGVLEERVYEDCEPGVAEAVQAGIDRLSAAGAQISVLALPEVDEALELFESGHVVAAELHSFLHRELPDWVEGLDMRVRIRLASAEGMSAQTYLDQRARLKRLTKAARPRLDGLDAILCPTVAIGPPLRIAVAELEDYRIQNLRSLRNTSLANTLGLCAVSLPVGFDAQGLPVGLQLMAPGGHDVHLAAVACAVQTGLGQGDEPAT